MTKDFSWESMMRSRIRLLTLLISIILIGIRAEAQSQEVPPQLAPWIEWVKQRHPERSCPKVGSSYECVWPGLFQLTVSATEGTFSLRVSVFRRDRLMLPSTTQLPATGISVVVDGKAVKDFVVERQNEVDTLHVEPGEYVITGRWYWSEVPALLPVPSLYGLLSVDFASGVMPQEVIREGDTVRFETMQREGVKTPDALDWTIARRLQDGSPLILETQIQLRVSGRARSFEFGDILPEGAVPIVFSSPLPAHLSEDGKLAVQLAPGSYAIGVTAHVAQPQKAIVLPEAQGSHWPNQEILSWYPLPFFRTVEIAGGSPVAGEVAEIPEEWKQGTLLTMAPGSTLTLNELQRGESLTERNHLSVRREFWVAEDGQMLTVRDTVQGAVPHERRLNATDALQLGRLTLGGQPWLITTDPVSGKTGTEIRNESVQLEGVSSVPLAGASSIAGWDSTMDSVQVVLNTPPSWKFLHAFGVPRQVNTGSWIDSWTLLSFFWVVLLVVAAERLLGRKEAVVVAVCFVLGHQEFLFPSTLFVYVLVLFFWCRILDEGSSWWRSLSTYALLATVGIWIVQVLSYAKLQLTQALFPQLQAGTRYRTVLQEILAGFDSSPSAWAWCLLFGTILLGGNYFVSSTTSWFKRIIRLALAGGAAVTVLVFLIGALVSSQRYPSVNTSSYQTDSSLAAPEAAGILSDTVERAVPQAAPAKRRLAFQSRDYEQRQKDKEVTDIFGGKSPQAGPAVPTWRWRSTQFTIPGPILADSSMRFLLMSPTVVRVLCALRFLSIVLLAVLVTRAVAGIMGWQNQFDRGTRRLAQRIYGIALLLAVPMVVQAEFPSPELLGELEQRLEERSCSSSECSYVSDLDISVDRDLLTLTLKATSHGKGAVALPGPLSRFRLEQVLVDGKATQALRINHAGFLEVVVPNGASQIVTSFSLAERDVYTLQFDDKPRFVRFLSADWLVEGVSASGETQPSIRVIRKQRRDEKKAEKPEKNEGALSPWITVHRSVVIGERTEVLMTVERIGSLDRPQLVEIPALPGEHITMATARSEQGTIFVPFAEGQSSVTFSSRLRLHESALKLVAGEQPRLTERWEVACKAYVSCDREGLQPVRSVVNGEKRWEWYPFPNETVLVKRSALKGKTGESVSVDVVNHSLSSTTKSYEGSLALTARTTAQSSLEVSFPKTLSLNFFSLNGVRGVGTKVDTSLRWILAPGVHQISLQYSHERSSGILESPPAFKISSYSYNIHTIWQPDTSRWLLWTGGGLWGPSVVFWSKLLVIFLFCFGLAKLGLVPLTLSGAAVLSFGLTVLPVAAFSFPLLWMALVHSTSLRERFVKVAPRWVFLTTLSFLTLMMVLSFYAVVETLLVDTPPMLVAGNGSTQASLRWFNDKVASDLPQPYIVSVPLWLWRIAALAWSTWLVIRLVGWFPKLITLFKEPKEQQIAV